MACPMAMLQLREDSVNRNIEVEDLYEQGYATQWMICDHVSQIGGLNNLVMTKRVAAVY